MNENEMMKAVIDDISKKHPNYSYIKGVGMVYDLSENPDFIEYCRLMDEYKRIEVNHEN